MRCLDRYDAISSSAKGIGSVLVHHGRFINHATKDNNYLAKPNCVIREAGKEAEASA
jgi:hypothetical protein